MKVWLLWHYSDDGPQVIDVFDSPDAAERRVWELAQRDAEHELTGEQSPAHHSPVLLEQMANGHTLDYDVEEREVVER